MRSALKAVVRFQSYVRRRKERRALVAKMQLDGTLLAVPGTVQGQSGWYEFEQPTSQGIVYMVVRYDVGEDDSWTMVEDAIPKTELMSRQ
jgi:hypothetical protein